MSNGAQFNLAITTPTCVEGRYTSIAGKVGINARGGGTAAIVYVIDLSGSTGGNDGLDCNGDGTVNDGDNFNNNFDQGSVLDCEIAGIIALNNSLQGTNTQAAVVGFGTTAAAADVSPQGGRQLFTTPDADVNGDGQADIETVVRSVTGSNLNQFGGQTRVGPTTNFEDALSAAIATLDTVTADQKVIFFLSDGQDSGGDAEAAQAAAKGITINTFGVGAGANECDSARSQLRQFASVTGGSCNNVSDPTQLSTTLVAAAPVGIQRVSLTADGAQLGDATIDALGNWSLNVVLPDGAKQVVASAYADDGTVVITTITLLQVTPAV